jgi:two-component system repressor protein LuxO
MQEQILLVEDSESLSMVYQSYLAKDGYQINSVFNGKDALQAVEQKKPDLILLDIQLPDMSGIEILKFIREKELNIATIIITAHGSVDVAVETMHLGAVDFLTKPFDATRLLVTVNNAIKNQKLSRIVETMQDTLTIESFHGFIGASLSMQAVYRIIKNAAHSKATIFITGESGTGKELCAEAVHLESQRKNKPFIPVNCAAIPKDLMESEIFGHIKGAFTGALKERDGAASLANGGTLFLDEIGEMDMELQSKLLRFIQTGQFQKVGSGRLESVDIRFVCATNRDPLAEVKAGRFREDLYYRLNVIPIDLPPLRQRGEDVLMIATQFLTSFSREEGKKFKKFSQSVKQIFRQYDWPGNIRQLQNIIRNIVVLNHGNIVEKEMMPSPLNESMENTPQITENNGADLSTAMSAINSDKAAEVQPSTDKNTESALVSEQKIETESIQLPENDVNSPTLNFTRPDEVLPLWLVEKQAINHAIDKCDGNIPQAAAKLEVSPSTLYRKIQNWENH